jgi:hypothetical protein
MRLFEETRGNLTGKEEWQKRKKSTLELSLCKLNIPY